MLSISKNGSLSLRKGKRLLVFEELTGKQGTISISRNLLISGISSQSDQEKLEQHFSEFGDLHVLDTQQIAQCIIIVGYFDIRNAKAAFNYFSMIYAVQFLSDPPFDDYSDILYIYGERGDTKELNMIFADGCYEVQTLGGLMGFKYWDLRQMWNKKSLLHLLGTGIRELNTLDKTKENKENLPPLLIPRKNPESLSSYVIDLSAIMRGTDMRTTLMIKNIPNKYTQTMLLDSIDKNHMLSYDFVYLPIDFKNKCNVGYAFINFVDYRFIPSFYTEFDGKKWEKFNSEKVCALAYARIQGRQSLIKHFQSSSIMGQEKSMRPVLLNSNNNY